MKHKAPLIITLLFVFTPATAGAAVQLTEIMYDVSGTDTGREWIEITNTGNAPVDVSGYKLFEANTNHALSLVQGSGTLPAGSSAVIADDDTKFKIDWPNYVGVLFDSSFSLSNTGETLVIKDSALNVLDTVTYDSGSGAAGDGNTLNRSGSVFVAAAATPGSYTGSSGSAGSSGAAQSAVVASSTPTIQAQSQTQAGGMGPPPVTVRISADARVMTGGGSYFSATAYGTQNLPLSDARFIWNFGDGATADGVKVFHVYAYPGRYAVSVTAAYNLSSGVDRATVEAVQAAVSLEAKGDGSLLIRNNTAKEINIGLWSLADAGALYIIPEGTIVLGSEGVRFAAAITNLTGSPGATLRYPNSATAAMASVSEDSPLRGERVTKDQLVPAAVPTAAEEVAPSIVKKTPPKSEKGAVLGTSSTAVAEAPGVVPSPFWMSLGALGVLLAGGVAAIRYLQGPIGKGTSAPEEEFDIE